ncbi:MAG: hypothetical protein ACK4V6_09915 [Microthrixaceae bacterium]
MTSSAPGGCPGGSASDEILRRVLPEPSAGEEVPLPPAFPTGVDARRQALLDAMGASDRESW